ncbi:putative inorganic phosphate cotransporter [Folsomia candida]|uniref:putative inorganic phosphate cotransporter n=1 Tax=Folsomia candida TaxID=158441 RepID=UPI000B901466|nr:putative inorganic phosphate cotransporter [Folsomia candida]
MCDQTENRNLSPQNKILETHSPHPPPPTKEKGVAKWGKRHTMMILGFFGTAIACSIQNNLSLAIVPMTQVHHQSGHLHILEYATTDSKALNASSTAHPVGICQRQDDDQNTDSMRRDKLLVLNIIGVENSPSSSGDGERVVKAGPQFNWHEKDQGLILSSFYWGYVVTQYPGGRCAHKYGGKWVFSLGIVLSGIFALLLPFATVHFGRLGLICVRVFQGLAQGITFPAIQVMLAQWSPPHERSRMTNLVYTGYPFGTAVTLIGGGYLLKVVGWPSIFFIAGSISLVWFVLWTLLVFNTPLQHPRISAPELRLIEESMKENSVQKDMPTPWRDILRSLPVWAIFAIQVGQFWGKNIIQIEMPKYLAAVHGLQIQHIGWIAALPQFLNCAFGLLTSSLSDYLIIKSVTSVEFTRKLSAMIVGCGTSAAFVGMALGGCHTVLALSCLLFGGVVSGASRGSWMVNMIDIAPNHAGTILAVGSMASYFLGMLAPYVTGILLHSYPTLLGWQIVLGIGAVANFSASVFYLQYAKCTEQGWNKPKEDNNNEC